MTATTGYKMKGRTSVNLYFNGLEYPLDINGGVDFIHIVESTRLTIPLLTMGVKDSTHWLSQNNLLLDGTQIQIIVNVADQYRTTYNFRLFSHKETLGNPIKYRLFGYLDYPKYWAETISPQNVYKGTSNDIIKQIATEAGITDYVGTTTSDAQSWLMTGKKRREAIASIGKYGWVDMNSCMVLGMTNQGQLRYVNITDFLKMPVIDTFVAPAQPTSDKVNGINDYDVVNKAGFANSRNGYSASQYVSSLLADATSVDKVAVVKNSTKLSVNKDVNAQITSGSMNHPPIDVGNVHAQYSQAWYQNTRLSSYLSFGIHFASTDFSLSHVLDIVQLQIGIPGDATMPSYAGKFIIGAKVVYVQGINYFEKYEVYRHGTNDNQDKTQE